MGPPELIITDQVVGEYPYPPWVVLRKGEPNWAEGRMIIIDSVRHASQASLEAPAGEEEEPKLLIQKPACQPSHPWQGVELISAGKTIPKLLMNPPGFLRR